MILEQIVKAPLICFFWQELAEENQRLQQSLVAYRDPVNTSKSPTEKSSANKHHSYDSGPKSSLREKHQRHTSDPETSLNEWALQACWPDQKEYSKRKANQEALIDSATPLSEYSDRENDARSRSDHSPDFKQATASCHLNSQTPGQMSDDVLRSESESDTPEHLRELTKQRGTPSTSATESQEKYMRPIFDLSPFNGGNNLNTESPAGRTPESTARDGSSVLKISYTKVFFPACI